VAELQRVAPAPSNANADASIDGLIAGRQTFLNVENPNQDGVVPYYF